MTTNSAAKYSLYRYMLKKGHLAAGLPFETQYYCNTSRRYVLFNSD